MADPTPAGEGNPAPAGEGNPAAGAAGESGAPAGSTPVEYSFKAPEGVTLDPKTVEQFTTFAKTQKLTPEVAQAVLEHQLGVEGAQTKAVADEVEGWKSALATHPEFGGEALEASRAVVNKAIALGTPELAKLLEDSGMVHHPVVFKWMHSIGKTLSEDRFVAAGAQPAASQKSTAQVLYPNNS